MLFGRRPEKEYELPCYDSHKSFYGKANVREYKNGDMKLSILVSMSLGWK